MISSKQLVLFTAIFGVGWGFGAEQNVLQESVQGKVLDAAFDIEKIFCDEYAPTSPGVQVIWKDKKSTPLGWNTHTKTYILFN
jgi:hypothetical protein